MKAIDTTGAGDAFIGAVISRLLDSNERDIIQLLKNEGHAILEFSNYVAAIVTTQYGAIESIPSLDKVKEALNIK